MRVIARRNEESIMLFEDELPEGLDLEECPMGCGNLTYDPTGGPCKQCMSDFSEHRHFRAEEAW